MNIKDIGAKSTVEATDPKIIESADKDMSMYMIKELALQIMQLHNVYAKFKKMGNDRDAEKIKNKIAKLSAEKHQLAADSGVNMREEDLNELDDKTLLSYPAAANAWRDKQGWTDDPKVVDKANRRAEFTQKANNRIYAKMVSDKEKQNAQETVNEGDNLDQQIELLQVAVQRVRNATKAIKHDDTITGIIAEVTEIARNVGISEEDFKYEVGSILEAQRELEAAVYAIEDIFTDKLRTLEWKKDDEYIDEAKGADNFTADDLTALSSIADIEEMKVKAKALISTPSKRPMKPEKIAWFNDAIDKQTNRNGVIKLMYDLLLSGEGNSVLGTRNSMGANSYRRRFGEGVNESDPCWDNYKQVGMKTKNGKKVPNCVPKESMGETISVSEGTSLKTTLATIKNDINEPVQQLYATLKQMAKQMYNNKGTLKGFQMVAGGAARRWYDTFYFNKLGKELHHLTQQSPQYSASLNKFLGTLPNNFSDISEKLPFILVDIGKKIKDDELVRISKAWIETREEYFDYLGELESTDGSDHDEIPKQKTAKNPVHGQQSNRAEEIVASILRELPSKIAGDIRNKISRSPNKLQALQAELQKRGLRLPMSENIKRHIKEGSIGNINHPETACNVSYDDILKEVYNKWIYTTKN